MDGSLSHPVWNLAPWSELFIDIEGVAIPPLRTRMKMLWDSCCLYIGAEMEEPHLWATLTERDSVIFQDNDFEVFIDPDDDHHNYVELEVNALGTEWDLLLPKPYRDGGPAINAFDIAGLRTAVRLEGSLNDPSDVDRGWSVTIALPFEALASVSNRPMPPKPRERWRINFSRVEWDLEVVNGQYRKLPDSPEHNWVWSPQWAIDMHRPELWGFLEFQEEAGPVAPDPYWRERCALMDIYHAQRARSSGDALQPVPSDPAEVSVLSHEGYWSASVQALDGTLLTLDHESRLIVR
ncbi:MAG TPA: carbohydrate-binding family 9-like protein [Fimbriimonadaceae bacterium]|nr:carbohydrate-binding family 9-like protein [Fimbriimonadaceae bacterium]